MATKTQYSQELENLIASLQNNTYTPRTEAERQAAAQGRFGAAYDQQRLSAQQGHETQDAALARELESLSQAYDKQREQSQKQYAQAYSQSDRHMLSRGMQRSSYGAQTLANLSQEGAEAQQGIAEAETTARTGLEGQRSMLAKQLAQQINQYDAAEQADILSYINELEQQDYERGASAAQNANQLAAMIYEYQQAEKSAAKKSSGSSGNKSGTGNSAGAATQNIDPHADLLKALSDTPTTSTTATKQQAQVNTRFIERVKSASNKTNYYK